MDKLIGAYGTLRKGASNHRVLGDSEYITTVELFGYKMYGKRDYPAIIRGAAHESVVLEVYRVMSQQTPHSSVQTFLTLGSVTV